LKGRERSRIEKRRVVITGVGVISPIGIGKDEFFKANLEGRSGIDLIRDFDTKDYPSKIAAQIKNFPSYNFIKEEKERELDRFTQFAIASSKLALEDSHLDLDKEDRDRIGVIIGSGLGGMFFYERQMLTLQKYGIKRVDPLSVPRVMPNAPSSQIAKEFNLRGINFVISTACSSGNNALGQSFKLIKNGIADIILSGGTEAPITPYIFASFCALRVLSRRNDSPKEASRPFDKNRDGLVMGEGSAVLVLEELNHALKRNAHIYAEIVGYACNCGAYHMVLPEPSGEDIVRVILQALKDADLKPNDIDYINAHGTSTLLNDKIETKAIKKVFGNYAYKIPISSTKSMIGHTIGAAGAIEAVVCCLVIENQIIPPTINYRYKDPDCDLDYVPNKPRKAKIGTVLSNSFGFGSNNACIILRRYDG